MSPSQVQIRDSNLIPKGQTICIQKAFTEHLLYTRHFSKHERQKWGEKKAKSLPSWKSQPRRERDNTYNKKCCQNNE